MQKEYLDAGRIVGTFGILGEVRIEPWCDSPEFLRGFSQYYIDGKAHKVIRARVHKNMVLALLEGYSSPEEAMILRGKTVSIFRGDVSLPEGTFFVEDLKGLPVFDLRKNAVIGNLKDVLNLPGSDVYVVAGEAGEILIPAVEAFMRGADLENGVIRVETIEGMGDEN